MKLKFDDSESLLIWLYLEISELFSQSELALYTIRFSPNNVPFFTDAELFTCGIFAELLRGKDKKAGYDYIKKHYRDWFPQLPSYAVYNRKLNKFYQALIYIYKAIRKKYGVANQPLAMIDTAPIEVCQAQHSRKSKAAQPFVSKGYCPAKKKYYIGAKLQIVAQGRAHKLPLPIEFALASASIHDLDIAKETLPDTEIENIYLYGDKAYKDRKFQLELFESKEINMVTPIKKKKGQKHLMLFQQAANSIHSSIRQPIDTLFGWIHKMTGIQNASKVRSQNGLFYHVAVKMVAALIIMISEF
ncbi:MAG: IS982 family transposase [bacterium]